MSYESIRSAIETRFYNNWTGTNKDTAVRYSNEEFEPDGTSAWASLDVLFAPSRNASIGINVCVRRHGVVSVGIYVPVDGGTGAALTLVDEAVTLFENQQFSDITCSSADVVHVGAMKNNPEIYVYKVNIPFYKYE